MAVVSSSASIPVDKKILLFDDLLKNDSALFLYGQGVDVWGSFYSFIESGLANGELCLCAHDKASSKLHLDTVFREAIASGKLHSFLLGGGYLPKEIEHLGDELGKLRARAGSEERAVRVLVDFGGLVTHHSFDKTIDFVRNIVKGETYHSRRARKKQPLSQTAITAFNLESLDENEIKILVGLHKNVVISSQDGTSTLALNFRTSRHLEEPGIEVAPKDVLEEFVKRHLETVVLSMLRERPMCGYDVIKTIYQRYHTFLSQGTVYPLLYSFEGQGLLAVAKAEGERSKVYTLTDEGRRAADRNINEFVRAQRHLLESIRK